MHGSKPVKANTGALAAPGPFFCEQLARYCVPLFDGAGVIGCSDDEPEPVVLGGVAVRVPVLAVVGGKGPLFAVLLLVFRPAKIMNPISSSTATPATQFRAPPSSPHGGSLGRSNADP